MILLRNKKNINIKKIKSMKKYVISSIILVVGLLCLVPSALFMFNSDVFDRYFEMKAGPLVILTVVGAFMIAMGLVVIFPSKPSGDNVDRQEDSGENSEEDDDDESESKVDIAFNAGKFWEDELKGLVSSTMTELQEEHFFEKLEDQADRLGIKYHGFCGDGDEGDEGYSELSFEERADECYRDGKLFKEALVEFLTERFAEAEVADKMAELKEKAFKQGIWLIDYA